ncbi:MAG: hypothetical protein ACKON8_06160 [Planctomycetota bacterium]
MIARLTRFVILPVAWAACSTVVLLAQPAAAAEVFDPTAVPPVLSEAGSEQPSGAIISDRIVLEPEETGLDSAPDSVLADGAVGGEIVQAPIMESVVESAGEPRMLEVSSQPFDGMLMDDFNLDEMPYEASSGRWFWNGGWYIGGESLWMERSRNNRVVIVEDYKRRPLAQEFIDVDKFTTMAQPFNVAPGARVTIGKSLGRDYLDRDQSLEFIYYGGMAYNDTDGYNPRIDAERVITPLGSLVPGFNGASTYNTRMNSDFNSWEWDYKLRRRLGRDQLVLSPGGNWTRHAERGWLPALIIGPRLTTVNEDFQLSTIRANVPASQFSGLYTINTSNWLLGCNIGGELISQNEFYYWGLRGRAAPALTFASTNQTAYGVNTTGKPVPPPPPSGAPTSVVFEKEATKTTAGFVGDLTLLAGWQGSPNFALQVGYDFLWGAGMATATRQFDLDQRDTNPINVGGQTFYNGFSFGFNGSW